MKHRRIFIAVCVLFIVLAACCLCGCRLANSSKPSKPGEPDDDPATNGGSAYELSRCTFESSPTEPEYDGTEQNVRLSVWSADGKFLDSYKHDEEHKHLCVSYSDNINAGTATAVITPKPGSTKYTGQATFTFTIKPGRASVTDEATLREYLSSGNYSSLTLDANIVVSDDLTVPEGVWLSRYDHRFVCNGDLRIDGSFTLGGTAGALTVGGDLTVNGSMTLMNDDVEVSGAVYNNGTIKSGVSSSERSVFGSELSTGDGTYENVTLYRRTRLSECEISLEYASVEYTGRSICPTVTVIADGVTVDGGEYRLEYTNNVHAGTAAVRVISVDRAHRIYGEATAQFDITPAVAAITQSAGMQDVLDDPDYDRFTASGRLYGFTLPQGKTLSASDNLTISNATVDGKIANGGTLVLENDLFGTGSIENNGTMFVTASAQQTFTIENNGALYIDDGKQSMYEVSGSAAAIRTQLSRSDVSLDSEQGDYNGQPHVVSLVFACADEAAPTVSYRYICGLDSFETTRLIDAGSVRVKVAASKFSANYFGEVELTYTIDPVPATVTDQSELSAKCARGAGGVANYSPITVDYDCVLPKSFSLDSSAELIVPQDRSMSYADSLYIGYGSAIAVYGRFFESANAQRNLSIVGELVNHGTAYFNGSVPQRVTGDGENILRSNIDSAQSVNFQSTVTYTGVVRDIQPSVSLKLDGAALTENTDFSVRYENASAITDRVKAQAVAIGEAFSTRVYGIKYIAYSILPGTCSVDTFEDLKAKTSDVRYGTTLCNWGRITVTAELSVACDINYIYYPDRRPMITVMSNTTVDFNANRLQATGEYSRMFGYVNHGTTIVHTAAEGNGVRVGGPNVLNYSEDSTGSFIGYADTAAAIEPLSKRCTEVRLTADVTGGDLFIYSFSDVKSGNKLVIDLCGHTITANNLVISMNNSPITVKNGTCTITNRYQISNTAGDRKLTFENVEGPNDGKFSFINADKSHVVGVTFD